MRSVLMAAALLLAATSAGQAQNYWLSGQQLAMDHCEKNMSAANRYVTGVMDGYVTATGAGAKKQFCPPGNVTAGQATAIACKYLKDNPKNWNAPAPYVVIFALSEAWPCSD